MAFTVEDGTVVENANSYVTVSFADTYHSDRGNDGWAGTDAVKQSALIKATDYIEQVYGKSWVGYQQTNDQSLTWPRTLILNEVSYRQYDLSNTIPEKLKQAVCILALESLSEDLNPAQDRAVKREKVDVIEVEYMDSARNSKLRPAIDGLLMQYTNGGMYNGKVRRV